MPTTLPLLLSLLAPQGTPPLPTADDPPRLIRIAVDAPDPRSYTALANALGLDLVSVGSDGAGMQVIARTAELARLDAKGLAYEVLHEDLQAYYASRLASGPELSAQGTPALGAWLTPPFGQGSMGGYYTWTEVVSVVNQIRAAYPSIVSAPTSLGQSLQGRDLWAFRVTDSPEANEGEPEVRMDSMHHSREPESMQALLWYVLFLVENYGTDPLATYLVDERDQWFVPVVNPDGYVFNEAIEPGGGGLWRKNLRDNGDGTTGVDLNRNYSFQWGYDDVGSSPDSSSETYRGPSPVSEPETAAMVAFLDAHAFATALTIHCFSDVWIYAWGYDELVPADIVQFEEISALATEVNCYKAGISSIVLYPGNGTTKDHDYGTHGTLSWTPEIGGGEDGFWPPTERIVPLAEENLLALQRTALAAGAFANASAITPVDLGDGDGFFEPGESVGVVLDVLNSGLEDTTTAVVATLTSSDADATVTDGTHDFGTLASYASASNAAEPLTFTLDAGATPGDLLIVQVELAFDGLPTVLDLAVPVGEAVPLVRDDCETDYGWTAGLPSDGASTGLWVLADPEGTDWNGEPSNPEDDATAGGTLCFTTGNGGGSAGADDVDDGPATLVSPPFDLADVGPAFVGYSRWFANHGSKGDDAMQVEISADGGETWTLLETVCGPENAWRAVSFRVADFVAPSDDMRVRFVISDVPNNSITEGAVDGFRVWTYSDLPRFTIYGSAELDGQILLGVTGQPGDLFLHYLAFGTADIPVQGVQGNLLVDPLTAIPTFSGVIPTERLVQIPLPLPDDGSLLGLTGWFQSLVFGGSGVFFTNRDDFTLQ